MASPYEFNWFQQLLWGWGVRWGWQSPVQDPMADLPVDRTRVVESVALEWPDELAGLQVGFPNLGMDRPGGSGSVAGLPVQLADPLRPTERWKIWHPDYGTRGYVDVPGVRGGYRWVEGSPRAGGDWDRRYMVCDPAAELVYEFIQCRPQGSPLVDGTKWHAQNWAVWTFDGERVDGNPIRGGSRDKSFHRTLFCGHGRAPGRLAMSIHDYGGGDGTLDVGFPRAGDVVRLSSTGFAEQWAKATDPDTRHALTCMAEYGVELADRNMNRSAFLYGQPGVYPRSLRELRVPLHQFELVVSHEAE